MLAPAPPEQPVQMVDVRDLGRLDAPAASRPGARGVFNATSPAARAHVRLDARRLRRARRRLGRRGVPRRARRRAVERRPAAGSRPPDADHAAFQLVDVSPRGRGRADLPAARRDRARRAGVDGHRGPRARARGASCSPEWEARPREPRRRRRPRPLLGARPRARPLRRARRVAGPGRGDRRRSPTYLRSRTRTRAGRTRRAAVPRSSTSARARPPAASSAARPTRRLRPEHDDAELRALAHGRPRAPSRRRDRLTKLDHDANVSPWLELAHDLDLTVRFVDINEDTTLDLDDLRAAARRPDTGRRVPGRLERSRHADRRPPHRRACTRGGRARLGRRRALRAARADRRRRARASTC